VLAGIFKENATCAIFLVVSKVVSSQKAKETLRHSIEKVVTHISEMLNTAGIYGMFDTRPSLKKK